MTDHRIRIAFAADAKYVPHAAAMLHSVFEHSDPSRLEFHFLHVAGLAPATLAALQQFVTATGATIHCHAIAADVVTDLPRMGRIPAVMWLRVFLPELLPHAERVLYLDCDTIVMDSLDALWDSELEGAWLGAVNNVFMAGQEDHARQLGLANASRYFNSGVLLIDLAAWRRERCAQQILALARDPAAGLVWPDQDALNRVNAGHWKALHPRWNCQNSLFYFRRAREVFGAPMVAEAIARPGILHFEGGLLAKPWHYLCKHPLRHVYFRHRRATPWADMAIEGRSTLNRILRPLPLPMQLLVLGMTHRLLKFRRRFRLP